MCSTIPTPSFPATVGRGYFIFISTFDLINVRRVNIGCQNLDPDHWSLDTISSAIGSGDESVKVGFLRMIGYQFEYFGWRTILFVD